MCVGVCVCTQVCKSDENHLIKTLGTAIVSGVGRMPTHTHGAHCGRTRSGRVRALVRGVGWERFIALASVTLSRARFGPKPLPPPVGFRFKNRSTYLSYFGKNKTGAHKSSAARWWGGCGGGRYDNIIIILLAANPRQRILTEKKNYPSIILLL